jgi:DtxR family Mn-dependent transcriptional regulator
MENIKIITESEQMYLVTIARLSEMVDECPIPISKVAEVLEITSISANQMVHHLEQMGLITYTPYKGVEFTETGWRTATKLLRTRRLWEVFLVEHLQYSPKDAETLACKLEHAISEETSDRLADFLGWPQVSPQGKPIPKSDKGERIQSGVLLTSLPAGTVGMVIAILTGQTEKEFLQQSGISVGSQITIVAKQQGKAYLIQCSDDLPVNLMNDLAKKIYLNPNI